MPFEIEIINPLDYDQWDSLIIESNQYSFFHSYEWIKVLRESYGYKPYFFILRNKRELSALLPFMEVNSRYSGRRGVSLPFSDYCDPIIREEISAQRLLKPVKKIAAPRSFTGLKVDISLKSTWFLGLIRYRLPFCSQPSFF